MLFVTTTRNRLLGLIYDYYVWYIEKSYTKDMMIHELARLKTNQEMGSKQELWEKWRTVLLLED